MISILPFYIFLKVTQPDFADTFLISINHSLCCCSFFYFNVVFHIHVEHFWSLFFIVENILCNFFISYLHIQSSLPCNFDYIVAV